MVWPLASEGDFVLCFERASYSVRRFLRAVQVIQDHLQNQRDQFHKPFTSNGQ
jgi:hypothetical protein